MRRFIIICVIVVMSLFCPNVIVNAQNEDKDFLEEFVYPEFVRYEATYRYQIIRFPRSSVSRPLTLGYQLSELFGDSVSFTDASVCVGSWSGISSTYYANPQELLGTDPILLVYGVGDGRMTKKYEEPNVTINLGYKANDGSKRYMTVFMRVRGFLDHAMYARMTIMYPGKEKDNCRTYLSNRETFVGSYITAFDANEFNVASDMMYYESLNRSLEAKIANNESPTREEYRIIEGAYETSRDAYDDSYAMWMYNDKRYVDAYQYFENVYVANRSDILSGKNEKKDMYYRTCFYMNDCLSTLGNYDKAEYFLGLAAVGGDTYAQEFSKLKNREVSARDINCYQYVDETKFDLDKVTVGQILNALYDVLPEYILSGCVKNNGNAKSKNLSANDAWNTDLKSLCGKEPSVLVLRYSKAGFQIESNNDKSKLFYDNSIIITVHHASKESSLWRVNVMIPNFRNYDFKEPEAKINEPLMSSFIISNAKYKWNLNDYQSIYDKCSSLIKERRCAEAMLGLKYIYAGLKKQYKGKSTKQDELYGLAGFWYGFSLVELGEKYKALAYLIENYEAGGFVEKEEFINALGAVQDVRTLDIIEKELNKMNSFFVKYPNDEEGIKYMNYILRRKAYVLIDQQRYDEAETILKAQRQTESDPEKLKLIESELEYIKGAKANIKE